MIDEQGTLHAWFVMKVEGGGATAINEHDTLHSARCWRKLTIQVQPQRYQVFSTADRERFASDRAGQTLPRFLADLRDGQQIQSTRAGLLENSARQRVFRVRLDA